MTNKMEGTRIKDITGRRYGRLTVLSFDHMGERYETYWRVRCDCGCEFVSLKDYLTSGRTRSCGCIRKEMAKLESAKRRIPVSVVGSRGDSVDYDSITSAAAALGVSHSTVKTHMESGIAYNGNTFIRTNSHDSRI